MLKRAYRGTFHKISPRHLNQCIQEFSSASSGLRQADTLAQMTALAVGLVGRRHGPFIADNGLPWEAGACHPRLKGYFGVPPGGIDASSHPIGNLSGAALIGPCRSSNGTIPLPLDDYPTPEVMARDRVDNALYSTKTFAAKSSVWSAFCLCPFDCALFTQPGTFALLDAFDWRIHWNFFEGGIRFRWSPRANAYD
ncbi:MAG: hypothetical protein M2R46_02809 [Verrucomicrobia subdivision 3 bacterium]|nr:hypothetical protein [Limisphaerales bacterium]